MDHLPKIAMQCPKCLRRFPLEETYCETCSAMLEPIEEIGEEAEAPAVEGGSPGGEAPVTDEKIEDVKIEVLRADIESKFVYTLLLEIRQLKRRLAKKETALSALREQEGGSGHAETAASAGRIESDVEELMKKTTKLEITLDNLARKLGADVESLTDELVKKERPGIGDFFSEKGRYSRMLFSELATKKLLLDVIAGRRPPSALKIRSLLRPSFVFPFAASAAIILALSLYTYFHNTAPPPRPTILQEEGAQRDGRIIRKEVVALLEDIKRANLRKDVELWKSRYSARYLASEGGQEDISRLWKRVDFQSLQYKIDKFESGPEGARATITWYMQLKTRRGRDIRMVSRRLRAVFAREGGRLKIISVAKEKR
jgi:hypothetical protein